MQQTDNKLVIHIYLPRWRMVSIADFIMFQQKLITGPTLTFLSPSRFLMLTVDFILMS